MTAKEPPKFDLATSNFPPLPGCVDSIQGETTPEMRLSDVVRGLKVTNKVDNLSSLLPWSPPVKKKKRNAYYYFKTLIISVG